MRVDVVDGVGTVHHRQSPINLFDMKLESEMAGYRRAAATAMCGGGAGRPTGVLHPHFDVSVILTRPTDLPSRG